MIKVAIVEDDEEVASQLRSYFSRVEQEEAVRFEVTWYKNAVIFLSEYRSGFDLILMDIEMPHMNGMEAAQKLREKDKTVTLIFVTNLAQFALKGYEVKARDFIVKPVKYYGFAMRVGSVVQELKRRQDEAILINTQEGMVRLPIRELNYVESFAHSLTYHFDGGQYESKGRESLTDVEEKLRKYGFLRCKSSFLVNLRAIKKVTGNDVEVGDAVIPIGRTKKKEFLMQMASYFQTQSL